MFFWTLMLILQADASLQEQFLALERRVVSGLHQKDATQFDSLLANDYVLRGRPDVDRATWIKNSVTLCWGDQSDIDEFSVKETDDAVIASFVLTLYQDPNTCRSATIRSLITDFWIRQNDEWRLAIRHSSPIAAAGADPIAQQFLREDPPPPRWEGASELSFVSTGGNASVQTLGIGSRVVHRLGTWETEANTAFVRSITEGVEKARSLAAQIRQSAKISPRLDLFGRSGYRRDLFAGIEHRGTFDTGIGYQIIGTGVQRLKIDTGLGYLVEQRAVGPRLDTAIFNLTKTWRWDILEPLVLSNDAVITMPMPQTGAWRLNNQLSITTSLTDLFGVKLSYTSNYLNQPVPSFGRTDTVVSAALVAKFERR